jgi:hypothetical protein
MQVHDDKAFHLVDPELQENPFFVPPDPFLLELQEPRSSRASEPIAH